MNAGLIVILLLLILSFLGIPIYIALGVGTLVALNMSGLALIVLPQKLFSGMNSTSLLAIPFFILAGNIMSRSITGKLVKIANVLIGSIKGSLGVVTVISSAFFGAISGSGVATASAIGGLTIPAMKEEGYPAPFASAISAISSIMGPIIPPSIFLIVYASITNVSVSGLFIGSVFPGVLLAILLSIYCLYYGKKYNLPSHQKVPAKEVGHAIREGIWALLMPIIILGGIFSGMFTPTEAAAVAAAYALIISLFVYKDMKLIDMPKVFVDASVATATIMVMVGLSKASSYVVVTSGLPQKLLDLFTAVTNNKFVIVFMLNILFLIIGMIMEGNAAIIMMTPLLMPLFSAFGLNTLQMGVVMGFNLCIGLVTPPVGLCLLLSNQIAETSFSKTFKEILPMLIIALLVLVMISYIPQLTLWLPSLLSTGA